ncbi:hypothetical protein CcCBS67573_g08222 [Chytriomyces confervae]|uniref:Uncharacterized protein n=1 Tax=Chytriomyces confervae TaxID=246404 RepID=A0A507EP66_9FUNG|nr:hypothetical protein CcCBS67573_g08222 [Chytriomyces confervae]
MGRKKNANSELYLAMYNAYKGVDPWSKQISVPHAKQGLQTDIVLGDEAVYADYASTMHTHYTRKQQPQQQSHLVTNPKSKVSITFGDSMKHQPERLQSMAADCYAPYSVAQVRACNDPQKEKRKAERDKQLQQWHTRPELMMSAAHEGTKTRQDIPLDTRHFHCFASTNADTYTAPANTGPLIRHDKKPRGATHIAQGHARALDTYATEATSAYIPHVRAPEPRAAAGAASSAKATNAALLGRSGLATSFSTTSQRCFAAPVPASHSDRGISVEKGQQRGRSNIAFGNHFEVPKLNYLAREEHAVKASVTQTDYAEPTRDRIDAAENNKWSKSFKTQPSDGYKTGMAGAIRPDMRDLGYASCAAADFSPETHHGATPAIATCSNAIMYKSSIPTGDETKFPIREYRTTTNASYPVYTNLPIPTFPVLGEKVTKSSFSLVDGALAAEQDLNLSTSGASYVNHGRRVKFVQNANRGYGLDMLKAVNEEYGMADNMTTNNVVYRAPHPSKKTMAYEPKTVPSSLLFPMEAHRLEGSYETSTQAVHKMRDGLLNVTGPDKIKGRNQSSIVFGDKKHFSTRGEPIWA